MTDPHETDGSRHSRALEPELIADPVAKAEAEARNGLRQYDAGQRAIQDAIERGIFRLRPSLILALQREALAGISSYAGNYRPAGVNIEGSGHTPPGAHLVAELVEDLCDYVNDNWEIQSALHLAAYVMWRLNWIHPFADGNVANGFLRRAVGQAPGVAPRYAYDPGSDSGQSHAIFRRARCC